LIMHSASIPAHRRALRCLAVLVVAVGLVFGSALSAPAASAQAGHAQSVHAILPSLHNVDKPRIEGLPVVGNQLVATSGLWDGAAPLFYSFAWRSTTKTLLTNSHTYTPTASDIGQVLTVRVTVQDGDNNSSFIDVSTPPITASDVVNSAAPKFTGGMTVGDTVTVTHGTFTSGSGVLTYTYAWSTTDGQSSTPLPDTGTTHVITTSDLGLYLSVQVTAASPTQKGTVTAQTVGAVIPAIPFTSDSGLTSANRGRVEVTTHEDLATISDPGGARDDGVFVYAYSKPTVLGWFALDSQKKFSVNYETLSPGQHKLVVIDQTGKVVGWVTVVRAADAAPIFAAANAPIGIAAAVFVVLVIVALILFSRARRRRRRRH